MTDRLREALEMHEEDYNLKMVPDHHIEVVAAARRWLALTETGPDYEAAAKVDFDGDHGGWEFLSEQQQQLWLESVTPIVDAALADYLTEEE